MLLKNLRLNSNPFSKRSSEQELEFINNIFYEPNYYQTLLEGLISGDTTLIIGQRGHGKSSVINKLFDDISNTENILVFKIDRFDSIPLKNNEVAFLKLITEKITTCLSAILLKNKKLLKLLNSHDKEKLAFFVKFFFSTLSDSEFKNIYEKTQGIKTKNRLKLFYNKYIAGLLNITTNTLIDISATAVTQHLGLNSVNTEPLSKEFFPNFKIQKDKQSKLSEEECTVENLKIILDNLFVLLDKIGIKRTVVLFDKIDEYQNLEQDLDKISQFIKDILADTELLLNNRISIGFSLWSELRNKLGGIVRYDKFNYVDVRWQDSDLIPLINKRIKYFTENYEVKLSDLITHNEDVNEIIKLSNKSPRDLIILLHHIFLEQSNEDSTAQFFKNSPIRKGMIQFCKTYDYDSLFPTKVGKGKEIKAMINRLLSLKLHRFTKIKLTTHLNQSEKQSQGQIRLMINYGLIRQEEILGDNGQRMYEVIDQKILFLIKHLIDRIE